MAAAIGSSRVGLGAVGRIVAAVLIVGFFLGPIVWILLLSVKPAALALQSPPVFWFEPTLREFREVFGERSLYPRFMLNSVIVAGGNTLLSLLLGLPAAYAFARLRFRLCHDLLVWILSVRIAPPIAVLLPFYLIMREIGLLDRHLALILIYLTFNLPFLVWIMKGFFEEVPIELEEAARMDGLSTLETFRAVVLPLVRPGIVITAIFAFIFSWNEFLFALVLTNQRAQTLPVAM
ncbi:MAG: carbohydrate ABC transporter permease, partial [Geminicoccales bacterium]